MEPLKRLIVDCEGEIVRRVLDYARTRGYMQLMPALEETYTSAVVTMSANLVQCLTLQGDVPPICAADDLALDPAASVGARMARMRAIDARDVRLFAGMLKYYRQAYLDVVQQAGFPLEDGWRYARAVERFFDRFELGVLGELAVNPIDVVRAQVLDRNAELAAEKDRYLSAFADLPVPVLFLDQDGLVENINAAAVLLFLPSEASHHRYHQDPSRRQRPPVLADELEAFRVGPEREASFERELKTGKGTRYFQVRCTKTFTSAEALSGMLVILNDLTYRRHTEESLRRGQAKYQSLFENMLSGFAYTRVVLDRRNRPVDYMLLEVNRAFERLTGLEAADIVGRTITEVLPGIEAGDLDWLGTLGRVALSGEAAAFDAYLAPLSRWYAVSLFSPSPGHVTLMLSDISELKSTQESLASSRDFYLTLFEGFPSMIWRAGADGRVDYVNAAWLDFTGRTLDEAIGESWLVDVHPEDGERCRITLRKAIDERRAFQIEYRLRHRSGEYRWVHDAARPFHDLGGAFDGLIGSTSDISDRKRQEEALERLATHDALTGLPNRRLLEEALGRAVAHARRGHLSSLLLLDLDGLKTVNDASGYAAGDALLRDIAAALTTTLSAEDLLSRVGGDRFGVLLQDTALDDAQRVAERLHEALSGSALGPAGSDVGLSIGIVEIDGRFEASAALAQADAAAYRAKEIGGDRVVRYVPDMESSDHTDEHTAAMLARLADALAGDGALRLHFQPVFRVSDGTVTFNEVTLRLADGRGGLLEASEFMWVAERGGLMPELSRWVLQRAASILVDDPGMRLSMNLSGADLADEGLVDAAAALLEAAGVSAERLSFELSESALLPDLSVARRWIESARARGFGFALDGFGRGYNSFEYLRELPVDRVKIDGSVVRSLVGDPRQLALVQAVQAVASSREIETVAECVENEYVLQVVRNAGVDLAQGPHLGGPGPDVLRAPETAWESRFPGGRSASSTAR